MFKRPEPTTAVSRQLNLDAKIKSPATASMASFQSTASILSPLSSKEPSPFRFPPDHHHQTLERRDSIFCGQGDVTKGMFSILKEVGRAHCSYLDICISQKIRLCESYLEGKFQTSVQTSIITFLI